MISKTLAEHDQLLNEVLRQVVSSAAGLLSAEEQASLLEALAADAKFREAVGNQVGSRLKQEVAKMGEAAVEKLPHLLRDTRGMLTNGPVLSP